MAQLAMHLSHKPKDLSLDTYKLAPPYKPDAVAHSLTPVLGHRDRQVPGAHWLASVAESELQVQ